MVVEVSDGYAKNFLLKGKMAVEANAQNMNVLKTQEGSKMFKRERDFEEAQKLAEKMKDMTLHFKVKAGEGGKLFGSVTASNIADEIAKQLGVKVDKKKINVADIKAFGTFTAEVKLYTGISAEVSVEVVEG
jgi:large subunit ribosomal protein L9